MSRDATEVADDAVEAVHPDLAVDGFHHVSAVVSDPVENHEFLTGTLGLRLVKRTVNYDEPFVHHLYYGDAVGTPGSVFTVFAYPRDDPGRVGKGQPGEAAFAVPAGDDTLAYWLDRFEARGIDHDDPEERFGETVVPFRDPDGMALALVATDELLDGEPWTETVPERHAIRGIRTVTLHSANVFVTARVLEVFGFELVDQSGDRVRYLGPEEDGARAVVDLLDRQQDLPWGKEGPGTVHHLAFEVADREALFDWIETLQTAGLEPGRVKDRHYFDAVYARDPGGILFELSTAEPGVTVDESVEELGSSLRLPPWLEEDREMIAPQLPPVTRDERAEGNA